MNSSNSTLSSLFISNNVTFTSANKGTFTPADEYFNRYLLGIQNSKGIEDLGPLKYDLAACLAIVKENNFK